MEYLSERDGTVTDSNLFFPSLWHRSNTLQQKWSFTYGEVKEGHSIADTVPATPAFLRNKGLWCVSLSPLCPIIHPHSRGTEYQQSGRTFCNSTAMQVGSCYSITLNVTGTTLANLWPKKNQEIKLQSAVKDRDSEGKNYQSHVLCRQGISPPLQFPLPPILFSLMDTVNSKQVS